MKQNIYLFLATFAFGAIALAQTTNRNYEVTFLVRLRMDKMCGVCHGR